MIIMIISRQTDLAVMAVALEAYHGVETGVELQQLTGLRKMGAGVLMIDQQVETALEVPERASVLERGTSLRVIEARPW
jgi:ABC-type branched-subunit amino acid transport system ATPase component